uniref:Uncharacterized protein n=1 Tax=viral metagenome TaxID=1070528 RepID=A0A6C0ESL8_9ZZZZ
MTSLIIIDKNGTINEKKIKTMDKLYSSCGYRTNKDFELLYVWNDNYELYGKQTGKPISENNYVFPLINGNTNKTKYYGNLCIIKKGGSLSLEEWNIFYTNEKVVEEDDNEFDNENILSNDNELSHDEYEEES